MINKFIDLRIIIITFFSILLSCNIANSNVGHIIDIGDKEIDLISKINNYLNRIKHLEGDFIQIAPDGTLSEGRFYLKRPGKAKFHFFPPSRMDIVSDGSWVGVSNSKLETTNRFPLSKTPFWALLADNVDLFSDSRILALKEDNGSIVISIVDASGKAEGQITLVFTGEDIQLRQWSVIDPQGLTTTIVVNNLLEGQPVSKKYFKIPDYSRKKRD